MFVSAWEAEQEVVAEWNPQETHNIVGTTGTVKQKEDCVPVVQTRRASASCTMSLAIASACLQQAWKGSERFSKVPSVQGLSPISFELRTVSLANVTSLIIATHC